MDGFSTVMDFGTPPGMVRAIPVGRASTATVSDGGFWSPYYYAPEGGQPLDWSQVIRFVAPEPPTHSAAVAPPPPSVPQDVTVSLTRVHPALAGPTPCQGIAA